MGAGARVFLALAIGVVFFVLYTTRMTPRSAMRSALASNSSSASYSIKEDALLNPNDAAWSTSKTNTLWSNPEITDTQKKFCTGNQVSLFCKDAPLHPFVAAFDYYGKKLKFPGEEKGRTVTQFLEMRGRMSSAE